MQRLTRSATKRVANVGNRVFSGPTGGAENTAELWMRYGAKRMRVDVEKFYGDFLVGQSDVGVRMMRTLRFLCSRSSSRGTGRASFANATFSFTHRWID
jgi:hypothetical protein